MAPAEGSGRGRIPLKPVDSLAVTTLVENTYDVFMPDQGPAERKGPDPKGPRLESSTMVDRTVPDQLVAEHGLSLLLKVTVGDQVHQLLFDCGVSPTGMVENMRRLGVDPTEIEAIVCSHGHFDHTTGLDGLIQRLGRHNLPVLIHPDFWNRRRLTLPGRPPNEIPTTSRTALEGAGFTIVEDRQPSFLFANAVLITGEVDRTTGYEPGFPIQQAWHNGSWQPDPLVLDDQAVVVNVRDKGLVVITGCGHAGVVNITRYAQALTGVRELYAIIGGFHLSGPLFEPLIGRVSTDLSALNPQYIVPAHCTGWRAQYALARVFGDRFIPNAVGTRYSL
ncbi:MAG: MBL fold metallo-hydrolase [Candidatus Dormibacteraeota bacterium]|nr:MBL fold metallo-hydrolase [Candidatus Dormibacteraeota bacterium]